MKYGTQEWCDWRNSTRTRNDLEWVIDGRGGAYLRDVAGWASAHTRTLAQAAEKERHRWIWRHNNPQSVTGAAG